MYSFRQIATWDRHMMDWLATREPELRGRLREEWIEAARDAHLRAHGNDDD